MKNMDEKLPLFSSSYIQIILIQRKDEDQDIGSSNDETYAADKVYESSEEGKPYIIAEFDYGEQGTFTIGDEIKYSKTGSATTVSLVSFRSIVN